MTCVCQERPFAGYVLQFVTNTLVHQYLQDTVSYNEVKINGNTSKQVIVATCPFLVDFKYLNQLFPCQWV